MSSNPCPHCGGRGGHNLHTPSGVRWIKCRACKPTQTRSQAKEAALHRYVSGNQNELARGACLRLGISERQLDEALRSYRESHSHQPELEGL